MQDPEVNDLSIEVDDDSASITYDVRIVRNSECCGDECKEYTFSETVDVEDEIMDKIKAARAENPDVDIEVEEAGIEQLEEGGHRYKKSYYGFTLTAKIGISKPTAPRTAEQDAELQKLTSDYATTNASEKLRARRAELFAIGRPTSEELGTMEISDKIEASGMDEMN
jgi:hypothetical protein